MDRAAELIDSLEGKIVKLLEEVDRLRTEKMGWAGERDSLLETIENQKNQINQLKNRLKYPEAGSGIEGNNRGVKEKINYLVREIDDCIELLNT